MTRYAQVHARAHSIAQLGEVVSAMRGAAAARAQQGKQQLDSVRLYADLVAGAIAQVLTLLPKSDAPPAAQAPAALVVLGPEHGFAGGFSERILEQVLRHAAAPQLFLVGSRCIRAAQARGLRAAWTGQMVSQLANAAGLADRIGAQLYRHLNAGDMGRIDVIFARPIEHDGYEVVQEALLPLDRGRFPRPPAQLPPLFNLPPQQLLERLAGEYLFTQLNEAIAHSFAAENQARLQTMSAAHENIQRRMAALAAEERLARQGEITAEIIELAAGASAVTARS